jgi:hypothetical protein
MIDWLQHLGDVIGQGMGHLWHPHALSHGIQVGFQQGMSALQTSPASDVSRGYCVQICAFLVPANLLATIQGLVMMAIDRPLWERLAVGLAGSCYATLMVLHVATWFAVGVVMAPTYVLMALAVVCLVMNGAIIQRSLKPRTQNQNPDPRPLTLQPAVVGDRP